MTTTDFLAQIDIEQRERELVQRIERRRLAGERAAARHEMGRLELIARMARTARAARAVSAGPSAC